MGNYALILEVAGEAVEALSLSAILLLPVFAELTISHILALAVAAAAARN